MSSSMKCERCKGTGKISVFNGDPEYYFFETRECPDCIEGEKNNEGKEQSE